MKIRTLTSFLLVLSFFLLLTGCGHKHIFSEATCTSPAICECGETIDEPLGHSFDDGISVYEECIVCGVKNENYENNKSQTNEDSLNSNTSTNPNEDNNGNSNAQLSESAVFISESCDLVLLKATDKNGDIYELVGTQTETYNSIEIKLGIIKNNEWLINLTTDMPFFDENGLLFTGSDYYYGKPDSSDLYDNTYRKFHYLGNGCFFMTLDNSIGYWCGDSGIFYNCLTGKSINLYTHPETKRSGYGQNRTIYFGYDPLNPYDNKYLITKTVSYPNTNYYLLDRNTLELVKIADQLPVSPAGAYADGMFATQGTVNENFSYYFYNSSGTKILDLSNFDIEKLDDKQGFHNGKCTFFVKNNVGTEFKITIDKEGNILEQIKTN